MRAIRLFFIFALVSLALASQSQANNSACQPQSEKLLAASDCVLWQKSANSRMVSSAKAVCNYESLLNEYLDCKTSSGLITSTQKSNSKSN